MSYGTDLLQAVEKGVYKLDDLPPRELFLVQHQYNKMHKISKVVEIGKIAHQRRITNYVYTGFFKFEPTS